MASVKVTSEEFSSGIVKLFKTEQLETAQERMGAKPGDIMFFVVDRPKVDADALGNLRLHLGRKLNMIDENRCGYFIDASEYGTPPHAGIAPGLDRIVMLMRNEENIREVIAFPKSQQGFCPLPLTHVLSTVIEAQLEELSICVDVDA